MDFLLALAFSLGLLLTAIATIRAAVFPRWSGILLLIGAGGFIFGFFVAELLPAVAGVLGVTLLAIPFGLAWIGFTMLREMPGQNRSTDAKAVTRPGQSRTAVDSR